MRWMIGLVVWMAVVSCYTYDNGVKTGYNDRVKQESSMTCWVDEINHGQFEQREAHNCRLEK